jgi:hypothetical protein
MVVRCCCPHCSDVSVSGQAVAGAGYQGPQFADAVAKCLPHLAVDIVKRSQQAKGFVVLPVH